MSWLTEVVRPRIRSWLGQDTREVPDLWQQCPACQQMIFNKDLDRNLKVCPHCAHHLRPTAPERLAWTFDAGQFTRIELPKAPADPLRFRDQKRYADRLRDAREKTGLDDAIMQEGAVSLMQMPRTTIAATMVKQARLPFITVLTDPTTGGVTASFAMLGDVQIAEPGALIGFAGARVIEQTVRETLPEGFQRAEYLHEHGIVDMVVPRGEMAATLGRVIAMLRDVRAEPAPAQA